jgi:hypothetical protein
MVWASAAVNRRSGHRRHIRHSRPQGQADDQEGGAGNVGRRKHKEQPPEPTLRALPPSRQSTHAPPFLPLGTA